MTAAAASPPPSSPGATQRGGRRELVRTPRANSLSSSSSSFGATAITTAGTAHSSSSLISPSASRRDVLDLTAALTEVAASSPARPQWRSTNSNRAQAGSSGAATHKGIDIVAQLPVEVAVHVFSHFDDQTDLLCASLVSKTWRIYALHRTAWCNVVEHPSDGWRVIRDAERLWNQLSKVYGKCKAWPIDPEENPSIARAFASPLATLDMLRRHADTSQKRRLGEFVVTSADEELLNGPIDWLRVHQARNYLKRRWDLSARHVVPLSLFEADVAFPYDEDDEDYGTIQEIIDDASEEELEDPFIRASIRGEIEMMKRLRIQPTRFEPDVRYLDGHEDSVYCIRLDSKPYTLPDGAIGIEELRRQHTLGPLYRADTSLGFGSRGRIFSGSRDKTVKIWDGDSGVCMHTLIEHRGSVLCMEFDDRYLVTGSSDQLVIVWDLQLMHERNEKPKVVHRLRGHTSPVLDLSMTERYMISCGKDTTVRVYDRQNDYAVVRIYARHEGPVNAGSLSMHAGKLCAVTASGEGSIQLWDVLSGQMLRSFDGHEKGLACVKFNNDIVVSGSNDQTVRVWDAKTGKCVLVCCNHDLLVRSIVYDHERQIVISGCYDGCVRLYNLARFLHPNAHRTAKGYHVEAWTTIQPPLGPREPVRIFDIQADATRILSGGEDNRIWIHDYASESPIMRLFA